MVYTPLSGLFLMGACISAIAAVGSVFELSSGEPDLGMTITGTILAITVPLCLICFLLAVKTSKQA
jgi:hypothetical protein